MPVAFPPPSSLVRLGHSALRERGICGHRAKDSSGDVGRREGGDGGWHSLALAGTATYEAKKMFHHRNTSSTDPVSRVG